MAIFARRSIQGWLRDLSTIVDQRDLRRLVRDLNRSNYQSIAAEWELAVLWSLSRAGEVAYEQQTPGGTKPDVRFALHDSPKPVFLADITTVSDRGLDDENPIGYFRDALAKLAIGHGLDPENFVENVDYERIGEGQKQKVRLTLPPKSEIDQFLRERLGQFFQYIAKYQPAQLSIPISEGKVRFSVSFDREKRFSGGGHIAYQFAQSPTRNTIANTLREKGKQLGRADISIAKGVIVCDAGCRMLGSSMKSASTYTDSEIVGRFFLDNSSVSFVFLVWVDWYEPRILGLGMSHDEGWQVQSRLILNPDSRYRLNQEIVDLLASLSDTLPRPVLDAANVARQIRLGSSGLSRSLGGSQISDDIIAVPARALVELLAGNISLERFFQVVRFASAGEMGPGEVRNQFARMLDDCRLPTSAMVEPEAEFDDDWIVFRFGEPDPALTEFTLPEESDDGE